MFVFIGSLILGIVIACLMLSASKRFGEDEKLAWSRAGVALVFMTLINTIAAKVPAWLGLIFYVAMLAVMGYMIYWWMEEGSTVKELITFAVIMLLMMLVTKACGARIYDITSIRWITGIINSIPTIVFLMSVGYMVADMIWFHENLKTDKRG